MVSEPSFSGDGLGGAARHGARANDAALAIPEISVFAP
jgi:hypothetical protein